MVEHTLACDCNRGGSRKEVTEGHTLPSSPDVWSDSGTHQSALTLMFSRQQASVCAGMTLCAFPLEAGEYYVQCVQISQHKEHICLENWTHSDAVWHTDMSLSCMIFESAVFLPKVQALTVAGASCQRAELHCCYSSNSELFSSSGTEVAS